MNRAFYLKVANKLRNDRLAESNVQIEALFTGINARMASALETKRRHDALIDDGEKPCRWCSREAAIAEHDNEFCCAFCADRHSRAEKARLGGYL